MNRHEYIAELDRRIRLLPRADREDAIAYYEGYFDDMGVTDEEDVTGRVDDPKEIAERILDECSERLIEESRAKSDVRNWTKTIRMILIGVISFPVAFPLVMVAFALVITLVAVSFALVIALAATTIGLVAGGIGFFIAGFFAFTTNLYVHIGGALVLVALGILLGQFALWLVGKLSKLAASVCERLLSRRKARL